MAQLLSRAILLFLLGTLPIGAAQAARVLFLATNNVPPGKFRLLEEIARGQDIALSLRYVDKLPAETGPELFEGFDAVFIDSYLQDYVRSRLRAALAGNRAPLLWLYEAAPAWQGLPDALARDLVAYYASGGRRNFQGFFARLAAHQQGRSGEGIAPPIVYPKTGIYHPKAEGRVFAKTDEYFAWKGVSAVRPAVIGILFHQQYLASEQTGFIDDLIARVEAGGALPLAFYAPAMDAGVLAPIVGGSEAPKLEVLINTQITLNAELRRRDLEALGVPVIQAMAYRRGDEAAWAADPQGVAMMDVPFYFAQAEIAGITDIQVAAATAKDGALLPIAPQAAAVAGRALRLAKLRRLAPSEKKVAMFFWNYPPGEKNLSASFLNLPRSLQATLRALKAAGYDTEALDERELILLLQKLLAPFYRDGELDTLLREGLAELLPVSAYRRWLDTLPMPQREAILAQWGEPDRSSMVLRRSGNAYFVVPRLKLGKVVLLPQAPRGEKWESKEKSIYHSTKHGPSHFYFASYLWARGEAAGQGFGADALVHFGTHGTQEWLPGKERGLSVFDDPMLAVGNLPVFYPYIIDDVGEAIQAKRRGRAVTISHQTPPFQPGGLHEALTRIHDLLHAWMGQDEGSVKDAMRRDLLAAVKKERMDRDLAWSEAAIQTRWGEFVDALHAHLHELSETAQPLGLHTYGAAPEETHRLGTVLLMLGRPFWEAAATPGTEADEAMVADYRRMTDTAPFRLLARHVIEGEPLANFPPALHGALSQAKTWYAALGAQRELPALLDGLAGKHLSPSLGGDPIKSPDGHPTGRNLYGFDPSRLPTPQAWSAGQAALEALLAAHRQKSGQTPRKIAFALWSVETMRHQGLLEAQVLWAMGVEPVWDSGGRVTGVKLVPRERLGRARVDVVLSATGLYRDHFPNLMKHLAEAARLAAGAAEEDNVVAANTREIEARLLARGMAPAGAANAARTRIFAAETGRYGTGLDDAALATDTWKGKAQGDQKLAALYLDRMQFAYGPDEGSWGNRGEAGVNLYAEHLRGTEAAVLSRTSNLYGMLTTDDPFQYLGGIALAVRAIEGRAPELYISNLRGQGSGRAESAAGFLAKELATRQFHPGYIEGLKKEGYAGTLEVLDAVNNFWGWTAVAREIVRDDQWQELVDVYVRDKHQLGLKSWFEAHNPHALAQVMERMLEAARQGYWQTDEATLAELKNRYRELAQRFDVRSDNRAFRQSLGYGLAGTIAPSSSSPASDAGSPKPSAAAPPQVQGMLLQRVAPPTPAFPPPLSSYLLLLTILLALLAGAGQGWKQGRGATESAQSAMRLPKFGWRGV